jgi:hypothetical protein
MGLSQSHFYQINDDDSANSTLLETELDACSIHHFAFCSPNSETWQIIKEHQYELRCKICGDDSGEFQVPVQCSWNDENEFLLLREAKSKLSSLAKADKKPCTFSTHLGCAIWGRNANKEYFGHRRVFFVAAVTDADGRIESHATINIFCDEHAQELHRCQASGCNTVRHPPHFRITYQKFVAPAPPPKKASSRAKPANDKPTRKRRAKTANGNADKKKSTPKPIKIDALVYAPVNDLVDTPSATGSPEKYHRPANVKEKEPRSISNALAALEPTDREIEEWTTDNDVEACAMEFPDRNHRPAEVNDKEPLGISNTSAALEPPAEELDDWTTNNDVEACANSAEPTLLHQINDTLRQEAVREILSLEEDGRYPHLEDILESAQSRWKTRLDTCSFTTFQTFWKQVASAVYDSLEHYSAEPNDWSLLKDPKAAEAWASEWDEMEVVQLGQPPPQLNRR